MRTLGIIPARGGSKGIPRKNIKLLLGKPLLWYTAQAALHASLLTRVVLSTEDEEIAAVGTSCGLDVPFMRPPELARDDSPTLPVLQDVVRRLERDGERYDAIMTLQVTSPLRRSGDIDGSIRLLERTGADSVFSFVDVGSRHPAKMKFIDAEGRVTDPPFGGMGEGHRRQDLPPMFRRDGSIYVTRHDVLMARNSLKGSDCRAWLIPEEWSCDIDSPFDFFFAEQLMIYHGLGAPSGTPTSGSV
jgi:CMP-N-acetylneuraminic acid synthetase